MHPILLRLQVAGSELALGSYSTFMVLAWVSSLAVGTAVAARRGIPWPRALAVFSAGLGAGIVGARLFDLATAGRYYAQDASRVFGITFQGFSLYGGFGVAAVVAILMARAYRLPVWRVADSAVPGLVVGIVLMRCGCFLRGCCFGVETAMPWGVRFPMGSPAWSHQFVSGKTGILGLAGVVRPVHPTQLYELGAALVLGAVALALMRRATNDGVAFLVFALGFTVFRLGNGFLRARLDVITVPDGFYWVFYAAVMAVLLALLAARVRARASEEPEDSGR